MNGQSHADGGKESLPFLHGDSISGGDSIVGDRFLFLKTRVDEGQVKRDRTEGWFQDPAEVSSLLSSCSSSSRAG